MKTRIFTMILMLAAGAGCSPEARLARLIEHHPELTVADTVTVTDSVCIPAAAADTVLSLRRMTDTVVVEKEQLRVKLFRQRDTLYVSGECKADTVYRERRIAVEKIRLVKPGLPGILIGKIPWLVIGLIAFLVIKKLWRTVP